VIAISLPAAKRNWNTMSFASTLYLCPILDLLTADLPEELEFEIRLGLQEALVNAAKHGNCLDPTKTVVVHFSSTRYEYCWVITDEGKGFTPKCNCDCPQHIATCPDLPPEEAENGRGLCMLYQIFDQVHWNQKGTQLKLSKSIKREHWRSRGWN
jgi:anti-sigma regulatory factor (Ser/Thr protein kinase)